VARRITTNLRRILTALRATGYGGRLVLVDYYSTSYSDPLATGASEAVNTAVNAAATGQDVTIADGYAAFQPRAAAAGGDSCKAGLLTRLSSGGCGVHPSAAGQALLATAVEKAAG
jgi:lysophospholipase L1-like esterase